MDRTEKLRKMIQTPGIIVVPGVYDALAAKIAEKAGHQAILAGGYAVVASLLGQPDMGIITLNEMADTVHRMSMVVNIPIIADIDTGFGEILNVIRTVKELESVGASAVQMEDQVFPKRAGLTLGREVIPTEQMTKKLHAAIDAKEDPDFVIIARTDAQPLDEAIKRSNAYYDAGADILFIEDIHSEEEMLRVNKEVRGPTLSVMVEGSGYPFFPAKKLEELGFKMVYYCNSSIFAATKAVYKAMKKLKEPGTTEDIMDEMMQFKEFNELIGFNEFTEIEKKYTE
ncbi:oxaloacetate decarboxylase [Patescibacteria group bacterium]|nr:oxaloacetate decarboxylase [Patescibacteria group bacterium]